MELGEIINAILWTALGIAIGGWYQSHRHKKYYAAVKSMLDKIEEAIDNPKPPNK